MEYEKVRMVVQSSDVNEVNRYLECGWTLLTVAKADSTEEATGDPVIIYSLGWAREDEPVQPKYSPV
jgi:hypothetical protein